MSFHRTAYCEIMLCIGGKFHRNEVPYGTRCFAAFYDQLYFGTNDGNIVLLSPNKPPEVLKLASGNHHPVEQLLVLGEIGILAVLHNGIVEIIDCQRLVILSSKFPVKGEILGIATNQDYSPDFALCVSTSHKIHILRWASDHYEVWKSLNIPSVPRSFGWSRNFICVALQNEVILLDMSNNTYKQVYEHVSPNEPRGTILALLNSRFVICLGQLGIIIGSNGQPTAGTLIWKTPPSSIVHVGDFVLSLHRSGKQLEVRYLEGANVVVDAMVLDEPITHMFAPAPWNTLPIKREDGASLEKLASGGGILLLGHDEVIGLGTVSIREKLQSLWSTGNMEEAWQIFLRKVIKPFSRNQSVESDSVNEFVHGDGPHEITAASLTSMYHADAGVAMVQIGKLRAGFTEILKSGIDPREVIAYFENVQPEGFSFAPAIVRPSRLRRAPTISSGKAPIFQNCRMFSLLDPKLKDSQDRLLHEEFVRYLREARVHFLGQQDILCDVDVTILNVYLLFLKNHTQSTFEQQAATTRDLEDFVRESQVCVKDVAIWAERLRAIGKVHASALLLSGDPSHRSQALQLWSDLGSHDEEDCDGDAGLLETVNFLSKHHEDAELVFVFSAWVLRKAPDAGIRIFVETENVDLDPIRVLEHLHTFDPSRKHTLRLQYLRFLYELCPEYGSALILEYIECLERNYSSVIHEQFTAFLSRKELFENLPTEEKRRTVEQILRRMDQSTTRQKLLFEKAMLLRRCRRHKEALEILVMQLNNHSAAETYCEESDTVDPFHDLLFVYLNPNVPSGKRDEFKKASMLLLRAHGSKLDACEVISRLPAEFVVQDIFDYLTSTLAQNVETGNQLRIQKNLYAAHNIKVRKQVSDLHRINVSITSDTLCKKCNKMISSDPFMLDQDQKSVQHIHCASENNTHLYVRHSSSKNHL